MIERTTITQPGFVLKVPTTTLPTLHTIIHSLCTQIAGEGMPQRTYGGDKGDLYVECQVCPTRPLTPVSLTPLPSSSPKVYIPVNLPAAKRAQLSELLHTDL